VPVEVRELVIRAYVDQTPAAEKPAPEGEVFDRDELIAECVELVTEILRQQQER